ncbi:MAG: 1-deoxy-D-xylulose-5-phosphate reductoisomerase [Oscillospiraceae bacterium]|nr:1-deoxy-D-xylulose-5-phosphate reductoisomerase [Oscillospiraceae bacterium]
MVDNVAVFGSTGSIGVQALEVASSMGLRVEVLTCGSNVGLLSDQIRTHRPSVVSVGDAAGAALIKARHPGVCVLHGMEGLIEAADVGVDRAVMGIVGMGAMHPTVAALTRGTDVAIASKEIMVAAGGFLTDLASRHGSALIPVDSEHSAIARCIGPDVGSVRTIYLTASGGPFRGLKAEDLKKVTIAQALSHPVWKMGRKITVDCATMMNKGMEIIEATVLFGVGPEAVKVVVHPQGLIHGMVGFADGTLMALASCPSMKIPIHSALTYPERAPIGMDHLDPLRLAGIGIEEPDRETFRCLGLAERAAAEGGFAPAVLNAANEEAVRLFLAGGLPFHRIPDVVEAALELFTPDWADAGDGLGRLLAVGEAAGRAAVGAAAGMR